MSEEKKVSDARAAIVAVIALALGALYVAFGVDWYYKGHLIMCYCELNIQPTSWCYRYAGLPCEETWWIPQCRRPAPVCTPSDSTCNLYTNSLHNITPCYRGVTAQHQYENSISHRFDFWWNGFFVDDENHRLGLATIVTLMYAAFLSFAFSVLKNWWLQSK
jgi:hypothetical protein